jgi:type I restriction enzyme, S subunit
MNADRLLALYEKVAEAPDAIARLRRFVLDLAVRGKLVPQDSGDEPIADHLRRIETASEILRECPANWACVPLRKILDFKYGKGMKASERLEEGPVPVFGSNGIVGYTTTPLTDKPAIIIGRKGSAGALNLCDGPSWTTDVAYFVEAPSFLDLQYLFLALQTLELDTLGKGVKPGLSRADAYPLAFPLPPLAEQRRIVAKVEELMALLDRLETARTAREATRDRLTTASLARLTAPDADPADFPANARFALGTLPALTTRKGQIKALRQTILNLAVRGKLVEQDLTDEPALDYLRGLEEIPAKARKQLKQLDPSACGGDLPASWVWLPLGVIIRGMDAGWSPQCENHPRSSADEWGVLKTTAVQALAFDSMQHKLLPSKLTPRPEFQAEVGDILVTRAGPKNRVGVSCVVDVPCPKLMISDKLIRFHAVGDLSARFIALTLNAGFTFEQIEAAKSGMAVMQMNISQAKLRAIPIPLPPLAEQHRIVAKVDALMALCDRLEAALTTTDTTRTRLLEALLHEALDSAGERGVAA